MKLARNFASAVALTASIILSIGSSPARAATPAPVFGTGQNLNIGDRDTRWKIIAAPQGFTPPDSQSIGYDSYVVNAFGPSTIMGTTFNWISINDTGFDPFGDSNERNWIFAQTFTVNQAGNYLFDFEVGADNGLTLFVNGNLGGTLDQPTITGGSQIGLEATNFPDLENRAGTVNLTAGSHTLYAVFRDFGGGASFIVANNNPFSPSNNTDVPAPLPLFGAAAAFGASRRLKRRIRLARPVAPDTAG